MVEATSDDDRGVPAVPRPRIRVESAIRTAGFAGEARRKQNPGHEHTVAPRGHRRCPGLCGLLAHARRPISPRTARSNRQTPAAPELAPGTLGRRGRLQSREPGPHGQSQCRTVVRERRGPQLERDRVSRAVRPLPAFRLDQDRGREAGGGCPRRALQPAQPTRIATPAMTAERLEAGRGRVRHRDQARCR